MLRYQLFLCYAVLVASVWIALMNNEAEVLARLPITPDLVSEDHVKLAINFLPVWLILLLGIWAVYKVIYGVIICKSCPEAAVELEGHVKSAKAELMKRGLDFSR